MSGGKTDTGSRGTDQRIVRVMHQVEQSLSTDWSLGAMAAGADLSEFHFCREFHRIHGESSVNWLTRLRLEHGAAWLKFTRSPQWEIAEQCGYTSREGFSRAFFRHFGESPGTFRRNSQARLYRKAGKTSVQGAAMPVTLVHMPEKTVCCIRSQGHYCKTLTSLTRLGRWVREAALPAEGLRYVGINYDEADITPLPFRRYDAGVICPSAGDVSAPGSVPHDLHLVALPEGWYARADFKGRISGLIHAWDWFIFVWLPASGYQVRHMAFFDEHPADFLLTPSLSWLHLLTRTFTCQLFIPLSHHRSMNSLPILPAKKNNPHSKIGHTLKF